MHLDYYEAIAIYLFVGELHKELILYSDLYNRLVC